jgi:2-polyprenyl-3-methyl-5-hydroxy-6-metoxy-1,4-benzoquinol methylase
LINDTRLYYEKLEDDLYEKGRDARAVQMQKILNLAAKYRPGGSLLDIGAASGILVEQALKMGFRAQGIEPSRRFTEEAKKRNLKVHFGTLPHPDITGHFDIITLIDVLEHIPDPLEILKRMSASLGRKGIGVVVTPDVESLAVRLMGWKWWHFRAAHIVYFSRRTLLKALDTAGLKPITIRYAGWVFTMDYLFERLMEYVPPAIRLRPREFMRKVMIPLNLLDSLIVIFENK